MNLLSSMSIWGIFGFFLMTGVGAYFYYRALAEIRGQKTREEIESFHEDELLAELQPITTVAFARLLPLSVGADLIVIADHDQHYQLERIALPIKQTRGLTQDHRRAFHSHQILALADALHQQEQLLPGNFVWPAADLIEGRLLDEWAGYQDRLAIVRALKTPERPLYPDLTIKILPASVEAARDNLKNKTCTEHPTESQAHVREQKRVVRSDKDRGLSIERVESAPESARPWRGEQRDERAGKAEETPDLPLDLVQSDTPVLHAIRTESRPIENTPSSGAIAYDEWDCVQSRYRRRYCQVQIATLQPVQGDILRLREALLQKRQIVREIVRLFDSLRPIPRRLRRQQDGDGIDIDAFVDQAVQMRLGGGFNENVYEKSERTERSVAVSLLLDLSASTERWVGKRRAFEIGIETAALFAMGEMVLGDDTEIIGFSGSGPSHVQITNFKRFDDAWSEDVFARLDQARPQAFTRLGAAIRHAQSTLALRATRQRLLLILSDARPQDEDGYEGHYAWADTRKALDEGRQHGIQAFCLTLDLESAPVLRLLFRNHYAVHLEAETLALRLPRIFSQLTQTY